MCRCGALTCFGCGAEGHWPASCEQQKWWTEVYAKEYACYSFLCSCFRKNLFAENEAEVANLKWLMRYTQECPKCSSPIEKVCVPALLKLISRMEVVTT